MADLTEKTQAAPATHKQPSRKGKKAWRKNVDITELQEGVEDVRDQIIQGYEVPLISLFILTTDRFSVVSWPRDPQTSFSSPTQLVMTP